jgi:hypothetical protein
MRRARAPRKIWRGGGPRSEDDFVLFGQFERDSIIGDDLGGVGVPGIIEGGSAFDAQRDSTADHLMSKYCDRRLVVEEISSPRHV